MHGRQHTGVSIYEARTETREKDERSCWSDGETAVETADGEMKIRQKEREIDKEGESKRVQGRRRSEGGCCGESLDERAQRPWVRSFASLTHHPRAKTRIFHPPTQTLSLRAKQTSLLLAFLATTLFANPLPSPHATISGRTSSVHDGSRSPLGSRLKPVAPQPMYTGQRRALNT